MSTVGPCTVSCAPAPSIELKAGLRWFPLVARTRPVRGPAQQRLDELEHLADEAGDTRNMLTVCSVLNRSALFALNAGLSDLAAQWCTRHAETLLSARPCPEPRAALEPMVNLLRLQVRAQGSMRVAENAYEGVGRTEFAIGDLVVPRNFADDIPAARRMLWMLLLEEGARLYASAGRWDDGYRFLMRHRGVGARMLDGRQLAVIAVARKDITGALSMLDATVGGHPAENTVTATLTALISGADDDAERAANMFLGLNLEPEYGVFRTRLGLAILTALPDGRSTATLQADLTSTDDALAARDLVDAGLGDDRMVTLIKSAGLGCGAVPPGLPTLVDRACDLLAGILKSTPA